MKKKRIFLGLALLASMSFSLAACGSTSEKKTSSTATSQTSKASQTATSTSSKKDRGQTETGGSSITLPDVFNGDTEVSYTIKHQLEQNDGSYETIKTETSTDILDGYTNAVAENYDGFTALPVEQVLVNSDSTTEIIIKYRANTYTLTLSGEDEKGIVAGSGEYSIYDGMAHLTAKPYIGYDFLGWYDGDTLVSDKKEYSMEVNNDISLTAKFSLNEAFKNYLFESDLTSCTIKKYLGNDINLSIPEGVTDVADEAFYHGEFRFLTLPSTLKTIGSYSFAYCCRLVRVELKSDCDINPKAFSTDYNIKEIICKTDANTSAICYDCSPNEIEKESESKIYTDESGFIWYNDSSLELIGKTTSETELVLPDSVTIDGTKYESYTISTYAFYYEGFVSVTVSAAVAGIGTQAFYRCSKLLEVINLSTLDIKVSYSTNGYIAYYAESVVSSSSDKTIFVSGDYCYTLTETDGKTVACIVQYLGSEENVVFNQIENYETTIADSLFQYNNNVKTVTIGKGIKKISDYLFQYCGYLESVDAEYVEEIGEYAFANCSMLKTVNMKSLTSVGFAAFRDCNALEAIDLSNVTTLGSHVFQNCTTLKVAEIGKVIDIPVNAFYGCTSLEKADISGAKTIGTQAFYGCVLLKNIDLSSAESIGSSTFYNNKSIIQVTLPSTLTTIGGAAFTGCEKLYEVINESSMTISKGDDSINGNVAKYAKNVCTSAEDSRISEEDGFVTIFVDNLVTLIDYVGEELDVVVPSYIEAIGVGAFKNKSITSLVIPNTVFEIQYDIIAGTKTLTSVTLPVSAIVNYFGTSISINKVFGSLGLSYYNYYENIDLAFNDTNLAAFPSNFLSASKFKSYTIPSTVTNFVTGSVGNNYTYFTEDIYYDGSLDDWFNVDKSFDTPLNGNNKLYVLDEAGDVFFNDKRYKLVDSITIEEGTEVIDAMKYAGLPIKSVTIPASVKVIGEGAFFKCVNLEEVIYAEGSKLETIEGAAFMYTAITELQLPSTVTTIEGAAFQNTKLTNVVIPETVTDFDISAVSCQSLVTLEVNAKITEVPSYAFRDNYNLRKVTLPDTVKTIGDYAFADDRLLSVINMPKSLESIGTEAFSGCKSLTTIDCENTKLVEILDRAFMYCNNLKNVTLPNTIEYISEDAFSSTGQFNYNYKDGAYYIGNSENPYLVVMDYNSEAEEIIIPKECVLYYGKASSSDNFYISSESAKRIVVNANFEITDLSLSGVKSNLEYLECKISNDATTLNRIFGGGSYSTGTSNKIPTTLTEIVIKEGLEIIPASFFVGSKLESVTIADSVTAINDNAFKDVTTLTEAKIYSSSSLETIGTYAFSATSLTKFVVPSGVTSISDYAFQNASDLKVVYNLSDLEIQTASTANGYVGYYASYVFNDLYYLPPTSVTVDSLVFTIFMGSADLAYNNGDETNIVIPSYVKYNDTSYPVKNILSSCFKDDTNIESIVIPSTLTTIQSGSFSGCTNLKTVYNLSLLDIEAGADSYGYVAYYADNVFKSVDGVPHDEFTVGDFKLSILDDQVTILEYTGSSTDIILPEEITYNGKVYDNVTISASCFKGNTDITSIALYDNIIKIEDLAFDGCENLKSVYNMSDLEIGLGSTKNGGIAQYADHVYTSLDGVYAEFDLNGFSGVIEDTEVTINKYTGTGTSVVINGSITYNGKTYTDINYSSDLFVDSNITSVTFAKDVVSIPSGLFSGCTTLTEVNFEEGINLLVVDDNAFYNTGITSINLPDTVEVIGNSSFEKCSALSSIHIPASVKSIGDEAFYESGLQEVTFAEDSVIETIGSSSFTYTKLTKFVCPESLKNINTSAFASCSLLTSITFNDYLKLIGNGAFAGTALKEVDIPYVEALYYSVFSNCTSLETAIINTPYLNGGLFYGCSSLKNVTFKENVKQIGSGSFTGCPIENLVIPSTVESVCSGAFSSCNIKNLEFNASEVYSGIFGGMSTIESLTIGDNVKTINSSAFQSIGITELYIPKTVQFVGSAAFASCTNLKNITVCAKELGSTIFPGCSAVETITVTSDVSTITTTALQNTGAKTIYYNASAVADNAFAMTKIEKVVLGDNVKTIGNASFASTKLLEITIPENVTSISGYAFASCTQLESIVIPSSVTDLGTYIFAGCTKLKSVKIYSQTIGEGMFAGNTLLTDLYISNNVKTIKQFAFSTCESLENVTIPYSVTTIGESAFASCIALRNIVIEGYATLGGSIFDSCEALESVYMTRCSEITSKMFTECTALKMIVLGISLEAVESDAFNAGVTTLTIYNGVEETDITLFDTIVTYTEYKYSKTKPEVDGNYYYISDGAIKYWE